MSEEPLQEKKCHKHDYPLVHVVKLTADFWSCDKCEKEYIALTEELVEKRFLIRDLKAENEKLKQALHGVIIAIKKHDAVSLGNQQDRLTELAGPWFPPDSCGDCKAPLRKFTTGKEIPCLDCTGILCESCCDKRKEKK